jgi:hypothetical protein
MALRSDFPQGFLNGVTLRGVPIVQSHPGNVYWVYNGTALLPSQRGGSDANKGTFNSPFATLNYAISQCVANRGDIVIIKPGHAESVISATALNFNVAGVAVIGLGTGTNRPTFTFTTANTATIPVTAANMSVQNCVFVANFLSIASPFTIAAGAEFAVQGNYFKDTSSVLNFLNIVRSTGAANTADGLTFNDNVVDNLGVTSNNTTVLTANTIDRLTMQRNTLKWAVQNNTAIGVIVTTGILSNALITDNYGYRPNTTTAGGSFINMGGTTSTGWVARNNIQTLTTTTDLLYTTTVGLAAFDNKVTGVVGASGFLIPTADS